jgi:hypothetical protein
MDEHESGAKLTSDSQHSPDPPARTATHHTERHAHSEACLNCGAAGGQEYCPSCGQRSVHEGDLSWAHASHHLVHEIFHLDGKIFRSLKLLFVRPGELTIDFIQGRRARHVHPLRLFIVFSSLFFFFAQPVISLENMPLQFQTFIQQFTEISGASSAEILARVRAILEVSFKVSVIGGTFLFAVGYWLLFRKCYPYLAQHAVMALHLSSFSMAVQTTASWLRPLNAPEWFLTTVGFLPSIVYALFAMRRVYGGPWRSLVWKWVVIQIAVTAIITVLAIVVTSGAAAWLLSPK